MATQRDPRTQRGQDTDADGYARVAARTSSYLHWYSEHKESAYIATFANISFLTANTPEHVAFIQNTSETLLLAVDEIRVQVVDPGATLPIFTTYFDLVSGLLFSAIDEGAVVTPRNLHLDSGSDAPATCYEEHITTTGTAIQLDRWVPQADGDFGFLGPNKETGALLLGQNDTIAVRYGSGTNVAYTYATITFHME